MSEAGKIFISQAEQSNPIYIIQERPTPYRDLRPEPDFPLLLGNQLATTFLALGKVVGKYQNARRLKIKSDDDAGVHLPRARVSVDNGHDLFSHIGGGLSLKDQVAQRQGKFNFLVEDSRERDQLRLGDFRVSQSTLVVTRRELVAWIAAHLGEAPANPHKAAEEGVPMRYIAHVFSALVDEVREKIEAGKYLLID